MFSAALGCISGGIYPRLRLMTYRDEFDEPPRGGPGFLSSIGPKAAFFIVLIALSFMIGVVWKLYVGASSNSEQAVPIVRADSDPFKVVPDEPGGMEIRHKDSTIFSSLKAKDDDSKVENLLASEDDEEPMPRSQLFAGLNTEKNPDIETSGEPTPLDKPAKGNTQQVTEEEPEPVVKKPAEPVFKVVEEAPKKVEPIIAEVKPEPVPVAKVEPKPEPKPVPRIEPSSGPKAEPVKAPPASGDYYIQLASVKDKARTGAEWKKLQQKYGQLSGYSYRVETAELGDRGTFYRIQAGPVSKDEAVAVCTSIKRVTPGGCLVKKK